MQFGDAHAKFRRFDHPAMGAGGHNPPDDFLKAIDAEHGVNGSIVESVDFLGIVPMGVRQIFCEGGVEVELDVVEFARGHHPPGLAEMLVE